MRLLLPREWSKVEGHPLILLSLTLDGVEFSQPAIIAEALAQAACHEDWIGKFLVSAEEAADSYKRNQPDRPSKTIVQLIDEIQENEKLKNAPRWEDGNKIRDGIIARAGEEIIQYASQFYIHPEELERKAAEMTNAVCFYTAASQHPPNMVMFDFYFM